jgi:hypothetical protein
MLGSQPVASYRFTYQPFTARGQFGVLRALSVGNPNSSETAVNSIRTLALSLAAVTFAGCMSGDALTAPTTNTDGPLAQRQLGANGAVAATVRVRCELRSGQRSKISVDGNNLRPLNGRWSAVVRSGVNVASASAQTAIGDEVEFDFDSAPDDIAAGAVAISRSFITPGAGPDVTAQILNASGAAVASGSAECSVR